MGAMLLVHMTETRADETAAVWGIRAGDRFVVSVIVVKRTEVSIGDLAPAISDTRDRFEIEYRVAQVRVSGEAVIVAQLRKANRTVANASAESLMSSAPAVRSLEDLRITFEIDPSGEIFSITGPNKEPVLAPLSGMDSSMTTILRDSCPEEVLYSWLARPFWPGQPLKRTDLHDSETPDKAEASAPGSLKRTDAISIGPFGTLQSSVSLTPQVTKDGERSLLVAGRGRFVPLAVPDSERASLTIPLRDVTAELDEFVGKIRLSTQNSAIPESAPGEPSLLPIPQHPRFEHGIDFQSMEITIRLHGAGTFISSPGREPQKVAFSQTQMQSWILREHSFARPEILYDVPVPQERPQ